MQLQLWSCKSGCENSIHNTRNAKMSICSQVFDGICNLIHKLSIKILSDAKWKSPKNTLVDIHCFFKSNTQNFTSLDIFWWNFTWKIATEIRWNSRIYRHKLQKRSSIMKEFLHNEARIPFLTVILKIFRNFNIFKRSSFWKNSTLTLQAFCMRITFF